MRFKQFDFVAKRKLFFTVSIAVTVAGIAVLLLFGLNLGLDFQSGTSLDILTGQTVSNPEVRELFASLGMEPNITIAGNNQDRVNARFDHVLSEEERNEILSLFRETYGDNVTMDEYTVDAEMAREFARNTMIYVGLASLLIALYVIIRFEWRFAVSALVALVHDAFFVITVFAVFRLEVNLPFVAALLTIIGYSINDTIVIFDRIRDNLKTAKLKILDDVSKLVNESIWQTMVRSINTGLAVLAVAIILMLLGSESVRLFSLAMVVGLIVGVYSSICIAAPLWAVLKNRSMKAAKNKKTAVENA